MGRRKGGRVEGRKGGRKEGREGGREGGREEGREGGREGGRRTAITCKNIYISFSCTICSKLDTILLKYPTPVQCLQSCQNGGVLRNDTCTCDCTPSIVYGGTSCTGKDIEPMDALTHLYTCIQYASVKMAASAVDQHVPVHLGTQEHGVRLLVPPAVQLVITLITATVVSSMVMHVLNVHIEFRKG